MRRKSFAMDVDSSGSSTSMTLSPVDDLTISSGLGTVGGISMTSWWGGASDGMSLCGSSSTAMVGVVRREGVVRGDGMGGVIDTGGDILSMSSRSIGSGVVLLSS
jgi:hypothetical protein